jgi:hypothetical protein
MCGCPIATGSSADILTNIDRSFSAPFVGASMQRVPAGAHSQLVTLLHAALGTPAVPGASKFLALRTVP